jgi:cell wall-associated NlpC family hydrolase
MDNSKFLKGFTTLPIDKALIEVFTLACMGKGVKYGLGSKDPTPKAPLPIDFKKIDCSGHFRGAINLMTKGKVLPPDGSWIQLEWCLKQGFKRSDFKSTLLKDNVIRVAISNTAVTKKVGHIWITFNGKSYESWSGNGPGIRPASTPVLERIVTDVFALA